MVVDFGRDREHGKEARVGGERRGRDSPWWPAGCVGREGERENEMSDGVWWSAWGLGGDEGRRTERDGE